MTDEDETPKPRGRIELNGLQVAAATAAAVTATVAASALGVAGTIIGAVLASVISTVGSAIYLASMRHTKEKLKPLGKHFGIDATRVDGAPPTEVVESEPETTRVVELRDPRPIGRATVGAPVPTPKKPARKPWKTIAATAAIVCVMTFGLVTIAEALLGHPLSGLFGKNDGTGTSLNHTPPTQDKPHTQEPVEPTDDPTEPTPDPTSPSPTPSASSSSPSPTPSSPSPSSPSPPAPGGDVQG
ncbi:hypothetical protein Afil01_66850 [Actinorhabdospora filicis]|uniref:Uncharacterized protein n=1 Tax=Actinorhabdospora filicis TaxID=1785913 RepID=A0A9W6WD95_9ACTN|nr:hypothetical protein [Actinorhabdospora filicis]GLZ81878.1 hypothetical protein Afil01_66850 [Actinorhabdospora filicis]